MLRMRSRRPWSGWLWLLLLVLCTASPACGDEPQGESRVPLDLLVSPDRGHVAFSLIRNYELPFRVVVVDARGREVTSTSPPNDPAAHDYRVAWVPDGSAVLCCRHTWTGEGLLTTTLFWLPVEPEGRELTDRGLRGFVNAYMLEPSMMVCRADGLDAAIPAGLYVLTMKGLGWEAEPLLLDARGRQWVSCLWGRRTESDLSIIVLAEQGVTEPPVTTFWRVESVSDGKPNAELLRTTARKVYRVAVSPDGSRLAMVEYRGRGKGNALVLLPAVPGGGRVHELDLPGPVSRVLFDPEGGRALLCQTGWTDPRYMRRFRLFVADLGTLQIDELHVPEWVSSVLDVAWLSEDTVLLSVQDRGIVKLNVSTGEAVDLWRIPQPTEQDEPEAPTP